MFRTTAKLQRRKRLQMLQISIARDEVFESTGARINNGTVRRQYGCEEEKAGHQTLDEGGWTRTQEAFEGQDARGSGVEGHEANGRSAPSESGNSRHRTGSSQVTVVVNPIQIGSPFPDRASAVAYRCGGSIAGYRVLILMEAMAPGHVQS
jgi:hypothetical protein